MQGMRHPRLSKPKWVLRPSPLTCPLRAIAGVFLVFFFYPQNNKIKREGTRIVLESATGLGLVQVSVHYRREAPDVTFWAALLEWQ